MLQEPWSALQSLVQVCPDGQLSLFPDLVGVVSLLLQAAIAIVSKVAAARA
jgi:hypothetical protein